MRRYHAPKFEIIHNYCYSGANAFVLDFMTAGQWKYVIAVSSTRDFIGSLRERMRARLWQKMQQYKKKLRKQLEAA